MVDNRSAGALGIAGSFNFKSGDPSGTAAKMSDEKMGQGMEYAFLQRPEEEEFQTSPFVDRSAQLSATLESLAMANVAGILKNIKKNAAKKKELESYITEESEESKEEFAPIKEISDKPDNEE